MKLFASLRWDGGTGFCIGLRGGGGGGDSVLCSFRHSGRSDKNQCRGPSLEDKIVFCISNTYFKYMYLKYCPSLYIVYTHLCW